MSIHNLRGEPLRLRGTVVAAAMGGDQQIRIGDRPPLMFADGQLASQPFDFELPPGIQPLRWKKLSPGGALLVREFRLERAE